MIGPFGSLEAASCPGPLDSPVFHEPEQCTSPGAFGQRPPVTLPISVEAYRGLYAVDALAQVYTMVGRHEPAITELEGLLSIPSHVSAACGGFYSSLMAEITCR